MPVRASGRLNYRSLSRPRLSEFAQTPIIAAPRFIGCQKALGITLSRMSARGRAKLRPPQKSVQTDWPPSSGPVLSENSIRHLIRAAGENRGIIRCDACHPARARNIRLRSAQVETPAPGREPVSAASTQYRLEAGTASASIVW